MKPSLPFLVLITVLLVACSSFKKGDANVVQVPNDAWWNVSFNNETKQLPANDSSLGLDSLSRSNIAVTRRKMATVSPIKFNIGFTKSQEINAFATLDNGEYLVVFTNGFMQQFGDDPDVIASVLGHELGHHQLGHTQPDYATNRNLAINTASQALGMLSSYFIPFSGLLVGNAVKGAGLSYSRDDEREADTFGMNLAQKAGFSSCGAYRFAEKMNSLGKGAVFTFMSTHPGNDERLQKAQDFTLASTNSGCEKPQNTP